MPSQCPCGQNDDVTHAMNSKRGGFIIIRHNNFRDFEANSPKTTLNDVEVEPKLQKIDNDEFNGLTGDDARPDIRARGVWRQGQNAFFDIRLTNTNAHPQKHLPVSTLVTFTPLSFSLTGGEGPETSMLHKHISQKIANKTEGKHEKVQRLIRCKLSFLILRSVLLCIRGSRSISKDSVVLDDDSLTCSAAGLF